MPDAAIVHQEGRRTTTARPTASGNKREMRGGQGLVSKNFFISTHFSPDVANGSAC